ncbi:MAG TPA: hypothetical protein VHO67_08885 [Polyangia bacterium]|nr:hypothetical protein [Polyangia bacterium]
MGEDRMQGGEMWALIERGREVRPAPDLVRARALLRARAAVLAGRPLATADWALRRARRVRVAVAALLMMTGGAVATAVGYALPRDAGATNAFDDRAPARAPTTGLGRRDVHGSPKAGRSAKSARGARSSVALQPGEAELRLLRRAEAAYVRGDQRTTLALVSDHAQRFPDGRLAEERDALRVQALAESGRPQAARRAAAAFAARYPHSVLLPQMEKAASGDVGP